MPDRQAEERNNCMVRIHPNQVTPVLRSHFRPTDPTIIRAFAVMAGGNAGKILTDDPVHPAWGLVWEADDGTLYCGGRYNREILAEAVAMLRRDGTVALGFRDGDPSIDLFPPDPDAGAPCFEFDRPIGCTDLTPYLNLPAGFELRRMDLELLQRSPNHEDKLKRFGDFQRYLETGIAVCILHGAEVVSEAYADIEVEGKREIGIITRSDHRKQGLATIACAHLIRLCEQAGCATYWDCARFNAGSVALAHKLGFQNQRAYKLLAWFRQG
jgi:RimJ/RimL family protein N-acetyltransferase